MEVVRNLEFHVWAFPVLYLRRCGETTEPAKPLDDLRFKG